MLAVLPDICLSFDLDWATETMLEHLYGLLEHARLPVTLMCTHDSPMVRHLMTLPGVQVGLHPNFMRGGDQAEILKTLHAMFEDAVGVRAHGLFYHSGLLSLYRAAGMGFLSTDLRLLHADIVPFVGWGGLVRLPIYWEDDVHCFCMGDSFEIRTLRLEQTGLKVLNFHPVHLYMNTASLDDYQTNKERVRDPEHEASCRNLGKGIGTLFAALLATVDPRRVIAMSAVALEASLTPAPHLPDRPIPTAHAA